MSAGFGAAAGSAGGKGGGISGTSGGCPSSVIPCTMNCMTMLSFRVNADEAIRVREVAGSRGVPQSEIIREALRCYLDSLAARHDAVVYEKQPLTSQELSLTAVEGWAPAEDWSDWADASG